MFAELPRVQDFIHALCHATAMKTNNKKKHQTKQNARSPMACTLHSQSNRYGHSTYTLSLSWIYAINKNKGDPAEFQFCTFLLAKKNQIAFCLRKQLLEQIFRLFMKKFVKHKDR